MAVTRFSERSLAPPPIRSPYVRALMPRLARKAGIEKRVHFLGLRTDIADILSLADVGLLTSHQEGFSNAVLEGMAAGLPMIVTNVGGNAEAVLEGETGIVVPPHDPISLAEAIHRMAVEPTERHKMGDKGKERLRVVFSHKACVQAYQKCYVSLVEQIDSQRR